MKLEVGKWYFRNDFEYYCVITSVEERSVRYISSSLYKQKNITGLKMHVTMGQFLAYYTEASPLLQALF